MAGNDLFQTKVGENGSDFFVIRGHQNLQLMSPKIIHSLFSADTVESIDLNLQLKFTQRYLEKSGGRYIIPTSKPLVLGNNISIQMHSTFSCSRSIRL